MYENAVLDNKFGNAILIMQHVKCLTVIGVLILP